MNTERGLYTFDVRMEYDDGPWYIMGNTGFCFHSQRHRGNEIAIHFSPDLPDYSEDIAYTPLATTILGSSLLEFRLFWLNRRRQGDPYWLNDNLNFSMTSNGRMVRALHNLVSEHGSEAMVLEFEKVEMTGKYKDDDRYYLKLSGSAFLDRENNKELTKYLIRLRNRLEENFDVV